MCGSDNRNISLFYQRCAIMIATCPLHACNSQLMPLGLHSHKPWTMFCPSSGMRRVLLIHTGSIAQRVTSATLACALGTVSFRPYGRPSDSREFTKIQEGPSPASEVDIFWPIPSGSSQGSHVHWDHTALQRGRAHRETDGETCGAS